MRTAFLVATLVLLSGCGDTAPDPAPARGPFDGTVTFAIPDSGGSGLLTRTTTAFLVVEKPGRKSLIDAWEAPEGTRHGRHNFPTGTTPAGVAAYYGGLLANAGWKPNVDYRVGQGTIHVFGVDALDAGSDNAELVVTISPQR